MHVPSDIADKPSQAEDETSEENDEPSSSGMINFEFSNGHPCGPHVPTVMDDDQYVEYEMDDLAGFPCDIEEEERMLMEAVMLSLKDMELHQSLTEEETSTGKHAAPVSSLTSSEGEAVRVHPAAMELASSDHPLRPPTPSNPVEFAKPSNTVTTSVTDNQKSATVHQAPSATLSSDPFISMLESESSSTSAALSNASGNIPNSTDSDL